MKNIIFVVSAMALSLLIIADFILFYFTFFYQTTNHHLNGVFFTVFLFVSFLISTIILTQKKYIELKEKENNEILKKLGELSEKCEKLSQNNGINE